MEVGVQRFIILLIFLFFCSSILKGKDFTMPKGKKLNELLSELAKKQSLLISFDDAAMSAIELPKEKRFENVRFLFEYLKNQHYVKIDTIGKTYVLSIIQKKKYTYQGKIVDANSKETLSNAEVICGELRTYSSEQGYFSFLLPSIGTRKIQVRHLGYELLDTVISARKIAEIPLRSHSETIGNVIVSKNVRIHNVNIAHRPGALKLTPKFVRKLPGYGESSIYSFLKLMPGILATGESVNDMSLRGSTEGQNLYIFDSYRVYNPWYRLNEIGTINPLLIRDIEVHKSGNDASVGENIGGVVLMKGIEAIPKQFKGEVFVNNFIANTLLEIPLTKKMAVIAAARKNIKETLKIPDAVGEYTIKKTFDNFADDYQMNINPKYNLCDANLKFIYKFNSNNKLFVSFFGSEEKNNLDALTLTDEFRLRNEQQRHNKQYADAIHFSNYSPDGKQLNITVSHSFVENELEGLAKVLKLKDTSTEEYQIENRELSSLEEFRLKAKRRIPFSGGFLNYGIGFTASHVKEIQQPKDKGWNQEFWHHLNYGFLNAQFMLSSQWNTNFGGRINYSNSLKKVFFEPRLSLSFYPNEHWKLYASYATLQQFVYSANVFDELKNSRYLRFGVGEYIPVSELKNWCIGLRYNQKKWTLSTELFYKYNGEKIRATYSNYFHKSSKDFHDKLVAEKVRYLGGDFFVKYQNKRVLAWLSYTLSDFRIHQLEKEKKNNPNHNENLSEDKFAFYNRTEYEYSKYDMRQEVKAAFAYTWRQLTLSASYVYGSGFKMWHQPSSTGAPDYSRLDIGVFYKLNFFATNTEVGSSILNLLNRKNKKLDEFSRFGVGDDIVSYNTYGLKLTPTFFIKIQF